LLITDLPVNHRIISKLKERGFESLTDIQEETILPALSGKDVMASSQTGSGKTLAFLIPSIQRLMTQKALSRQDPRALILAPTRELAKQVFIETKKITAGTKHTAALIVGGDNYNDQVKALRKNPDILVGTAGRIADHLESRHFFLNGLELLILDEADRMLDLGFSNALLAINKLADHRKRQTLMFSATLDNVGVTHLAAKLVTAPVRINIGISTAKHNDINQSFYFADSVDHKDDLLKLMLSSRDYDQAVVFTATREDTVRLSAVLNTLSGAKWDTIALSGDLAQNQRAAVMNAFAVGQHSILVTTDVASRGLDLPKVGLVVNFDLPKEADEYIHRIGRTGRAGQQGEAISLVGKRDWRSYTSIKSHLDYEIDCRQYPESPSDFQGFEPKPAFPNKAAKKKKKIKGTAKSSEKKKRINTLQGTDVGDAPIFKRKSD
jgi:superfamily II DNA/RNA helicase